MLGYLESWLIVNDKFALIPTSDGKKLLLSVEEPATFEEVQ